MAHCMQHQRSASSRFKYGAWVIGLAVLVVANVWVTIKYRPDFMVIILINVVIAGAFFSFYQNCKPKARNCGKCQEASNTSQQVITVAAAPIHQQAALTQPSPVVVQHRSNTITSASAFNNPSPPIPPPVANEQGPLKQIIPPSYESIYGSLRNTGNTSPKKK